MEGAYASVGLRWILLLLPGRHENDWAERFLRVVYQTVSAAGEAMPSFVDVVVQVLLEKSNNAAQLQLAIVRPLAG